VKIGLVSDTHGSAKTFQKALSGPLQAVGLILHAGDILHRGAGNPLSEGFETTDLAEMINGLRVPILIARGNCDSDMDQLVLETPIMSPYVFSYVEGMKIMVVHGNGKKDGDLEKLVEKFGLSLLVHGHSHIARIKKAGQGLIVNPGTPTIPNPSSPYRKTVGVFDSESGAVEIRDIETMEVVLRGGLGR
jgi:uncharacterized protein